MAERPRIKGRGAEIFLGSGRPASQQTSKPAKQRTSKPAQQHFGKPVNATKATFYLPVNLVDELDATWLSLRSKYRDKKVSKSEIAQIALEEILKDWKEHRQDSTLVNRLPGK